MEIFASDVHRDHHAVELDGTVLVPSWDRPERVDSVADALKRRGHVFAAPDDLDDD